MTKRITISRKAVSSVRGSFGHLHLQHNYDILTMAQILRRIESERGPILARSRHLQLDTNLLDHRQHQIHYDHLPQLERMKLRMLMLVRQANMPSFRSLLCRIRKSQVLLLLLDGRDSKFCLNPYMLWTIRPIIDVAYLLPRCVDPRDCSWSVLPSRIVSSALYDYLSSGLCLANVFFTDCIYQIACTVEEGSRSVVRWRSTIKCQHPDIVWTWVKNVRVAGLAQFLSRQKPNSACCSAWVTPVIGIYKSGPHVSWPPNGPPYSMIPSASDSDPDPTTQIAWPSRHARGASRPHTGSNGSLELSATPRNGGQDPTNPGKRTLSTRDLITLSISMAGAQIAWTVELG